MQVDDYIDASQFVHAANLIQKTRRRLDELEAISVMKHLKEKLDEK